MKTLKEFSHINARTVDEAIAALTGERAVVIAGGTDLLSIMRFEVLPDDMYPKTVVNLKSVTPSLDYIKEEGGMLKVGALTRLEDITKNATARQKYTALAEAAARTASPHIREMGTIGGNICQFNRCWYFRKEDNRYSCFRKGGKKCFAITGDNRYHSIFGGVRGCIAVNPSDTAPALVALNARVITNKRTIDAENFWTVKKPGSTVLDPAEIITEIQVPYTSGLKSAFAKFALRSSIDFPIVNCAVAIADGQARVCLNAVYNVPYRATKAENAIKGRRINEVNAEAAGAAAVQDAVVIGYKPAVRSVGLTNPAPPFGEWKIQVAKTLVKRTILRCK